MNGKDLQTWLNAHGQSITVDGKPGQATRAAIVSAFTNLQAAAITDDQVTCFATRLGVGAKNVRAAASVESAGSGYDRQGRVKLLYERHIFWRLTVGKFGVTLYSDPNRGGYDHDSWDKLGRACAADPDAAFASASWGKFQVLGTYWHDLGYASPIDLAYSTVTSEAGHYELFCRYIEHFGLTDELAALSTNPDDCRAFAKAYNGRAYEQNNYHVKLARAMV